MVQDIKKGDIVYFYNRLESNAKHYGIVVKIKDDKVYASWDMQTLDECIRAKENGKVIESDGFMILNRVYKAFTGTVLFFMEV